jgi:hypothetical protein
VILAGVDRRWSSVGVLAGVDKTWSSVVFKPPAKKLAPVSFSQDLHRRPAKNTTDHVLSTPEEITFHQL